MVSQAEHLQVLVPYIHLNPVAARLVTSPELAHWTSYTDYLGLSKLPGWLSTDVVLAMYGSRESLAEETLAYYRGEVPWPMDFDLERGIFTGWSPTMPRTEEERRAWQEHQLAEVAHIFTLATDLPWSTRLDRSRGRKANPARRMAAWLLRRKTDLTNEAIAQALEATAGQVSHMLNRLRAGRHEDPLATWMKRAEVWLMDEAVRQEREMGGV